MRSRDVVGVALGRQLERAIGSEWANMSWLKDTADKWYVYEEHIGKSTNPEVSAYTIGDLTAYCESRKWRVKQIMWPKGYAYSGKPCASTFFDIDIDLECGISEAVRDKSAPAALAKAVLAAVEAGDKK